MDNKFDEWNKVKKDTENSNSKNISVGKIYWVKIGQNIGSETYGKGNEFTRPVLVINKLYIKGFMNAFIGVPLSSQTKNKSGYMYHKFKTTDEKQQVALLSQIRVFDTKRAKDFYKDKILKSDFETIRNKIKDSIIK